MDMPHSQAQSMEQVRRRILSQTCTRCTWVVVRAAHQLPKITLLPMCVSKESSSSSHKVFGCIAAGNARQVIRGVEGVPAAGRAA